MMKPIVAVISVLAVITTGGNCQLLFGDHENVEDSNQDEFNINVEPFDQLFELKTANNDRKLEIPRRVKLDPEVDMDIRELIESKGYLFEEHKVTTADGYILTLHRIPGLKNQPNQLSSENRPSVLIQHGLLCDSSFWVLNLPDQNLPFLLANKGIDVWLGNNRGNKFSRNHTTLSPDSEQFWDFSWDEMAAYDIPAMVHYIRNRTLSTSIFYVGHSEGTMIGFSGFGATFFPPVLIKRFYALAPVAKVRHIKSPIRILAKHIDELVKIFGNKDFLSDSPIFDLMAKTICAWPKTNPLCANILFVLCGFDPANMNNTRIPVYVAHTPSGTSVKNMVHFAQGVLTNKFQKYDYGSADANMQHYNQPTPPEYNISRMAVSTVTFTGGNDWLADPRDVLDLISQLPNLFDMVNYDYYDHLDFGWGIDANRRIYDYIINDILMLHHAS